LAFIAASVMALASSIGCGPAKVVPVNGQVKMKDGSSTAPLKGYMVTFESVDKNVSGSGEIEADGTFKISTFSTSATPDGAVPGKHKVAISPPLPPPDAPPPRPAIDRKYFATSTSNLEVEVNPASPDITIEVEPFKGP
jgi:hypothetical protein